ncbi:MAG: glycerol-3-phosphate acyltransferase [Candidatus Cryosericum sp.]
MLKTALSYALPIVIGYLLGSILPAYFLVRWTRHADIRMLGDHNPGATNVKRNFGIGLGAAVAAYDLTKGLVAMLIAYWLFKAPTDVVAAAGFAAILGHKFPFYLHFRGGRGIAATVGIFVFLLGKVASESMSPADMAAALSFLAVYAVLIMAATHDEDFLATTLMPMLGIILAFYVRSYSELTLVLVLIGMISFESSKNLKREMFVLAKDRSTLWRTFARPLAIIVVILGMFISRRDVLLVVGGVLSTLLVLELLRATVPTLERALHREILSGTRLLREAERSTVSAFTLFLLGIFVTLLLSREYVAYASLGFLSIGGMMARVVDTNYGKSYLFKRSRTSIQGLLAFLAISIGVAYFLWIANDLPLWIGLVGAGIATLAELLPERVSDNVSVPVVSGAIMEGTFRLFV